MPNILTLNKIAKTGTDLFDKNKYNISDEQAKPEAILLRSASMHEMELPITLKAIARAGAGTNNIPIEKCTEKGIVVFNTPGANANAVKELVVAAIFLSSRNITDGINWAQNLTNDDVAKQVEKGKSAFAGPEIHGKTLGVIGLGAIGMLVANTALLLGMNVIGFDPYLTVDSAWRLDTNVKKADNINEIYEKSDYISLHVPLSDKTKGMINNEVLATTKKGVRIINFSRAGLVDEASIIEATENDSVACYITDFPTPNILGKKSIIPIPHLGASTPESEENCAKMASQQLIDYLENGNIKNSVNFPNCNLERCGNQRICVAHDNIPNMIGQISTILAKNNINIKEMINKSRDKIAYTIIDIEGGINGCESKIMEIDAVKVIRVL